MNNVSRFDKKPPARRVAIAALQNEAVTRQRVEALEAWRVDHAERYQRDIKAVSAEVGTVTGRVAEFETFRARSLRERLRWLFLGR